MIRVDLVVTDHILQGRSGTDLAADIKGKHPATPVVLQSGAAELLNATEHVDLLLSKAEHPSVLLRAIATLLKQLNLCAKAATV